MAVLIYMDDIIIIGDNFHEIEALKRHLNVKFHIKDLGNLCYFLGIEVAYSSKGLFISHRKYTLDLLKETGKLGVAPAESPIKYNSKFADNVTPLPDNGRFQREGELVELPVLAQPEAAAVGFLILDHQVSRARPRWWKLRKGLVGATDSWTEAASGGFAT
ncbi:uncharacterized mitochondrial protein AtMg00810-like [Syzygium oleosum]|uniref:uncharacterized mitochondrial protein AtMg00810-like n=1 Tax=Syzygium oleosum TaxID=219896 RepID=UPI0011D27338|nr:uncharacterized mitochondrial protein AtMg00810-like [Syzygium oleosum]